METEEREETVNRNEWGKKEIMREATVTEQELSRIRGWARLWGLPVQGSSPVPVLREGFHTDTSEEHQHRLQNQTQGQQERVGILFFQQIMQCRFGLPRS